jgi:hypothetical protein
MTIVDYSLESDGAPPSNETGARGVEGSWDRPDWQRMWLRTQSFDWKTLALVPGDDQTSTFDVANLIAKLALDHGESIHVADMRALGLKHVNAFLEGTLWETNHGTRIIFATRSTSANLATVRIARAADFAILCVSVGSTSLDGIRGTIELIGKKHFLGSLLVRRSAATKSPRPSLPQWTSAPKSQP